MGKIILFIIDVFNRMGSILVLFFPKIIMLVMYLIKPTKMIDDLEKTLDKKEKRKVKKR